MSVERIPPGALDAIPYSTRWTIANCLRAAAARWTEVTDAELAGYKTVRDQLNRQAADAITLAEQFEEC